MTQRAPSVACFTAIQGSTSGWVPVTSPEGRGTHLSAATISASTQSACPCPCGIAASAISELRSGHRSGSATCAAIRGTLDSSLALGCCLHSMAANMYPKAGERTPQWVSYPRHGDSCLRLPKHLGQSVLYRNSLASAIMCSSLLCDDVTAKHAQIHERECHRDVGPLARLLIV